MHSTEQIYWQLLLLAMGMVASFFSWVVDFLSHHVAVARETICLAVGTCHKANMYESENSCDTYNILPPFLSLAISWLTMTNSLYVFCLLRPFKFWFDKAIINIYFFTYMCLLTFVEAVNVNVVWGIILLLSKKTSQSK